VLPDIEQMSRHRADNRALQAPSTSARSTNNCTGIDEMSDLEPRTPRKKLPTVVALLVLLAVALLAAGYHVAPRFEREAPVITLTPDTDMLGTAPLQIGVADRGAGLKSITATLSAGGTEHPLVAEVYETPVGEKKIGVAVAKLPGIKEGPAVLRVSARDGSLWKFLRGNETVLQKQITIDVTPPAIELVAEDRYVSFGGVGAIVYKPAADTARSAVRVGDRSFPGYKGVVKGQPEHYFALFAHPYDAPAQARAVLVATDKAGNTREMPLVYELKDVKYRKSTIAVSDRFIETAVAPLVNDADAREGGPREVFVAVNNGLRKKNDDTITAITKKSGPTILWKGAFVQLSNSKVEANFADERTYTYNNEPIDKAYHLGYDLSVTKRYPVEAANSGTVAFAGDLGIYGNTVILDHGLGLFTLYSHLSAIDVKAGDTVEQRRILGKTGQTGLAAGDHLHYGVYLHGVAVLPVEWWDPKWIEDNLQPKLDGLSGEAIAEMQHRPRRSAQKTPRR
jgi:murein DD-endopeptidase MepM/ murein hydrolase activator NlpD